MINSLRVSCAVLFTIQVVGASSGKHKMSSVGCYFESADQITVDASKNLVFAPTVFGLDTSSVTDYSWECEGSDGVCEDFDSQIETKSAEPYLTVPAGLFSEGEIVTLLMHIHGQPETVDLFHNDDLPFGTLSIC